MASIKELLYPWIPEFFTENPPVDSVLNVVVMESKIGMSERKSKTINIKDRAMYTNQSFLAVSAIFGVIFSIMGPGDSVPIS